MGTCNFHNVNASKVFACALGEDYDYQDLIDNIKSEIEQFDTCSGFDPDELKNFPTTVIGAIYTTHRHHEVSVIISLIARRGYYSMCNLDWSVHYEVYGDAVKEIQFGPFFKEYFSPALAQRKTKVAEKWALAQRDKLIKKVEDIYKTYSTPLRIVGRSYNGETFYERERNENETA